MTELTFAYETISPARSFEQISGKYGNKIVAALAACVFDKNTLMLGVEKAWEDPTDKIPLQSGYGRENEDIRAISLQARSGMFERAVDKCIYILTGLARVDIVFVLKTNQIIAFETGWDFYRNKISIEGAKMNERRDGWEEILTPEAAGKFLSGWLGG